MAQHSPDIVRAHDRDRYIATLFAPETLQADLFALYAFNAEVARVRDVVHEPQVGEIRLQWWIDTLDAIARGENQDHPVASELAATIARHKLPVATLQRLTDAHRFDLYVDIMGSLSDLEGYLGETEATLFQLGAIILGAEARRTADTAGLYGVALGIARLMSAPVYNAKFIPPGETAQSLRLHGLRRLSEARALDVPQQAFAALLPAAVTETYVAYEGKPVPAWRRQWVLWRAARRERI
jgi:15-cis-phytoene synthase